MSTGTMDPTKKARPKATPITKLHYQAPGTSPHVPQPQPPTWTPQDSDLVEAIQALPKPRFQYAATPQEDLFAQNLTLFPPLQAYLAAGYASLDPPGRQALTIRQANALQKQPPVFERVNYYQKLHAQRLDLRIERLLQEQTAIALSDIKNYFDEHDSLLPIHQIPVHARAAIRSLEGTVTETFSEATNTTTTVRKIKLKLYDKQKALDSLHQITGLITSDVITHLPKVVLNVEQDEPESEPK
jgi:hypothetical protein